MKRGDERKGVIIYEASAGSGKTKTLVDEVFRFIESQHATSPEEVLERFMAITFTNAAAEEMKKRVLKQLKEKVFENDRKASEKYEKLVDAILMNYSDFHISTIDSLINAVIRCTPLENEVVLFPEYDIVADPTPYIDRALDVLFKMYSEDEEIERIINEYIDNLFSTKNNFVWDIRSELKRLLKNYRDRENREGVVIGYWKSKVLEDYSKCAKALKKEGVDLNEFFPEMKRIKELEKSVGKENLKILVNGFSFIKGMSGARVYHIFKNVMNEITRRDRKVFLDELNKIAYRVVKGIDETSLLLIKLGVTLRAIFVDEFQDTNMIQWENLSPFAKEVLGNGGILFCVGDKKQAIYGFRGGTPELIDMIKESLGKTFGCKVNFLKVNRRSKSEIVKFNNRIFTPENINRWVSSVALASKHGVLNNKEKQEIGEEIASLYSDAQQSYKKRGGYVYVRKISADKVRDENYYQEIIRILKEEEALFDRYSLSDVAFLLRENDEVSVLTKVLLDNGIKAESPRTLDVRENPLIKEIISLLKFLADSTDDLSFCAFVAGRIFEKVSGIPRDEIRKWIEQERNHRKNMIYRFKEVNETLYQQFFAPLMRKVGYLPLYELVKEIYDVFEVYSLFPDSFWFFRHFEEVVRKVVEDGIMTVPEFLDFLKNDESDIFLLTHTRAEAVKVTTIHRAKGLEFPVVVLPFLYLSPNHKVFKVNELMIEEDSKGEGEHFVRMMYCTQTMVKLSSELQKNWKERIKRNLKEEINVLYVALTRAVDELYVFLPDKTRHKNIYIPLLLGEKDVERCGEKASKRMKKMREERMTDISPFGDTTIRNWEKKLIKGKSALPSSESEVLKKLEGEYIHQVLAKLERIKGDVREIVDRIIAEVSPGWEKVVGSRSSTFRDSIIRTLEDEKVKAFFEVPEDIEVYTEKEICSSNGDLKRMDRVIVGMDEVTVIDFKWGEKKSEEHNKQVLDYMTLLKEVYPEKRVRGFLVYIEPCEVIEVI